MEPTHRTTKSGRRCSGLVAGTAFGVHPMGTGATPASAGVPSDNSAPSARFTDGHGYGVAADIRAGFSSGVPYADFAADAACNGITLTPDFLKSLTDGARVTLTFRFWSGGAVTYQVSGNGTTVTSVNAQA